MLIYAQYILQRPSLFNKRSRQSFSSIHLELMEGYFFVVHCCLSYFSMLGLFLTTTHNRFFQSGRNISMWVSPPSYGPGRIFCRVRSTVDFSKAGDKNGKISFYLLETKKTSFICLRFNRKMSNFKIFGCPSFRRPWHRRN